MDDRTWTSRSKAAEDLWPRISFLLSATAYVGDPNSSEQIHSGEYDRPLRLPSLAAREPMAPTVAEALGHEPELAAYYRQVIELTGQAPASGAAGYWLGFCFASEEAGSEIGFPWWDQISDPTPFFDWLRSADDNADFFDGDQGWMLRAARRGDRLFFLHGALETDEEFANLSVGRGTFLGRLDAAESQARTVIAGLKRELGVDPWS